MTPPTRSARDLVGDVVRMHHAANGEWIVTLGAHEIEQAGTEQSARDAADAVRDTIARLIDAALAEQEMRSRAHIDRLADLVNQEDARADAAEAQMARLREAATRLHAIGEHLALEINWEPADEIGMAHGAELVTALKQVKAALAPSEGTEER